MGLLDGPLRINTPRDVAPAPMAPSSEVAVAGRTIPSPAAQAAPAAPEGDLYLSRLVKLIPSEVVALYLTFKEIASSWLGLWALICLGLVVVVRVASTRSPGKPLQAGAVTIACVSFVLWIYATGGTILSLQLPATPGLISVSVGVWTFLLPYLYKGTPSAATA